MDKIQELTSKLYSEGVEKGKQEAEKIIAEANAQKKQILDEATAKAQEIIAAAEKQSAEMRSHTEAELKLFAAQAIEALKTEITNLITDKLASDNVKAAMQDQTFIQKIIVELVRNWSKNEKLTIGVQNSKELETYIASNAKDLLDKGLKIESVNGIKSGFTLSPEDGSYKVKFGEEEFIEYFKEFLRPQVQKLLFQ
ncbi:MAG: V/A-type H+/Na+-transporting ATPase subunit [Bacteroidota bacterium]|jgi:V/A-type H+-transporting ATPase subunit E|nr:V/A-type H+/Na+-transporting ATPase subunit [Bacteroidota bacterium]MDK2970075.1 V/A-type H+/Na+-transporting ATPase subunit [Bacteroidota bacterium]MDN5296449.1 V/A-type H+/Na+-transporting ATPase subunit [Bacteroidota bacterium]MDN5305910.1 V/A-type H+/Na+-transporting ATPase subunit [Bacteroidota bacterium]